MTAALVGAGVSRDAGVVLANELRLGRRGQGRTGLAPRGVKVVQRLQLTYQSTYLLLAVDPRRGSLRWRWLERCRAEPIRQTLADWPRMRLGGMATVRIGPSSWRIYPIKQGSG